MKTLLILISILCFGFISTDKVNGSYITFNSNNQNVNIKLVGYDPVCGCPIYIKWVFVGYDYYGRPLFAWRTMPIIHKCQQRGRS